eukprot:403374933
MGLARKKLRLQYQELQNNTKKSQRFGQTTQSLQMKESGRFTQSTQNSQPDFDKNQINKTIVQEFMQCLTKRKITPEEFFRGLDKLNRGKISNETFKQALTDKQIFVNKSQTTRLVALIDEDFSGEITLEELKKTIRSYNYEVEPSEGVLLNLDQFSIIKVVLALKERDISPQELFNAIDLDSNQQISLLEIQNFISKIINQTSSDSIEVDKQILDKEVQIFMNYMDIDNNGSISKAEFLFQFGKLDKIAAKNINLYQKEKLRLVQDSSKDIPQNKQLNQNAKIEEVKEIVNKMAREGLYFEHFIHHLKVISEDKDGTIKLGLLLKQLQLSFPNNSLEEFRKVLQWVPMSAGKYNIIELEVFLARLSPNDYKQNSLFQAFLVIDSNLKIKKLVPNECIKQYFGQNTTLLSYEMFNRFLSNVLNLPQETIIEVYNSMIIEQQQSDIRMSDLMLVLDSFYYQTDKISISNIQMYIENFENLNLGRKKALALQLIIEKMIEKKLQPINIFKMASPQSDIITLEQIQNAFTKLLPIFSKDLIDFAFNEKYTKEQFYEILKHENLKEKPQKQETSQQKQNYIKILDDALLKLKMSPALLFKQTDINNNKKIDIMELKESLQQLKSQMNNYDSLIFDDNILKQIILDLDVNGDGQLQEEEFYSLFKQARLSANFQNAVRSDPLIDLNKAELEKDSQIKRADLLPTRPNLLKLLNTKEVLFEENSASNFKSTSLNEELIQCLDEIEKKTSLKNALYNCDISAKFFIRLRDLSTILKKEGVDVQKLVKLYQLIDTEHRAHVNAHILLQLINEYTLKTNKPYVCNVEFKLLSKTIYLFPQSLGSVQEYFSKNSDEKSLGAPDIVLNIDTMDREFQKLFKFKTHVNNHIFELVSQKFKFGLDKLYNKHLFLYLQQVYQLHYPQEVQKYFKALGDKTSIVQQEFSNSSQIIETSELSSLNDEDVKQKILRKLIVTAQGQVQAPIFMRALLARYGFPVDKQEISLLNFIQMFTKDNLLITQQEAELLFAHLHDIMGVKKLDIARNKQIEKKINSLDFCDFINKLEQQIIQKELKMITSKIEGFKEVSFHEVILHSIQFVQDGINMLYICLYFIGLILKSRVAKIMGQKYIKSQDGAQKNVPVINDYEIYFLLNQIDLDNNQNLEIDEIQNYLKLYTSQKQINMQIYFKYFGYKLEQTHKKIATKDVLQLNIQELKKMSPDASKQFLAFITRYFDHAKKPELLLDLFEFMAIKIQDSSLESVISYLFAQIDIHRPSIPQGLKFMIRSNVQIRNELIKELLKQRPNFPIYRIMDDLQFNQQEGGIIPNLGLKNHLRKLYSYIEDQKLDLFVALVDVNNDRKIEVTELFKFLNEIYGEEMTYEYVLNKLAVVIYSTKETVESFFSIHQINLAKLQQNLTFFQFIQALAQIFKISKYEGYIIFEEIKIKEINQIDFKVFVDCLKGQLMRLEAQNQDESDQSEKLETKIQKQKDKIADALKNKLTQMLKLKGIDGDQPKKDLNDQDLELKSERKSTKLSNLEVLKLFLDNYSELNNLNLIQKACLNLNLLFKQSSVIRARLLTKRVCLVEFLYNEMGRTDLWSEEDEIIKNERIQKVILREQEKLVLTVLAIEVVSKTYECNIYRFQKMIKRLNERSALDFQMLSKILEQRFKQISELLFDDFINIQTIIEKIKTAAEKFNMPNEIQFAEKTTIQELLNTFLQMFNLTFKPKEIVILSRELKITKDAHAVAFNILKVFMAQCGIKIKLKETLNFVFDTFEQAQIGLQTLKNYIVNHPYVDLHKTLIKNQEFQNVEWLLQNSQQQSDQTDSISLLHKNSMLRDCIQQMRADQVDKVDHIKNLIKHDDGMSSNQAHQGEQEFVIIMIKDDYVICDKTLPYQVTESLGAKQLYTTCKDEPLIPLIEKAIAIFLGTYDQITTLQSPYQIFQLLNYLNTEIYTLPDKLDYFKQSYQNLYDNYFQPTIMRHIYFKMPISKKRVQNPLIQGLEGGRVYSIIAFIHLKIDAKISHNLIVIYNPYTKEDSRKNGELWSKSYLQNTKKNQKMIDLLKQEYDPSVYEFISDSNNQAFTYDFRDVFEHGEGPELDLVLYYNFQTFEISKEKFGLTYCKQFMVKIDEQYQEQLESELYVKLYYLVDNPFKLDIVEINYEVIKKPAIGLQESANKVNIESSQKNLQLSMTKSQKTELVEMVQKPNNEAKINEIPQIKDKNTIGSTLQVKGSKNIVEDEEAEYYDEEYDEEEEKQSVQPKPDKSKIQSSTIQPVEIQSAPKIQNTIQPVEIQSASKTKITTQPIEIKSAPKTLNSTKTVEIQSIPTTKNQQQSSSVVQDQVEPLKISEQPILITKKKSLDTKVTEKQNTSQPKLAQNIIPEEQKLEASQQPIIKRQQTKTLESDQSKNSQNIKNVQTTQEKNKVEEVKIQTQKSGIITHQQQNDKEKIKFQSLQENIDINDDIDEEIIE